MLALGCDAIQGYPMGMSAESSEIRTLLVREAAREMVLNPLQFR